MSTLWTTQGREYRPTPAELTPGWTPSPAIERGLWEHDPGITRVIGAVERPLLLASGEQISLVALVATGDPDGREFREWIPVTARIVRDGEARLAREEAPKPDQPTPAERENPDHVRAVAVRAAHAEALPALKAELAEAEERVSRLTATPPRNKWARGDAARAEERVEHLRWIISRPQAWAEARAQHLVNDGIDHGSSPWGKEQE